jgi:hypothetical protein
MGGQKASVFTFHSNFPNLMKYFTKHRGPQNRLANAYMGRLEKEVKLGSNTITVYTTLEFTNFGEIHKN